MALGPLLAFRAGRSLRFIRRMSKMLAESSGEAEQRVLSYCGVDGDEVRTEKSKKEQVFEWLEQRQAYVDDAFNGRKQSMADVRAEMEADFPTMKAPEWHDWTWDADGNIVRAPDRSKKP